jgi:hypothetical protein
MKNKIIFSVLAPLVSFYFVARRFELLADDWR